MEGPLKLARDAKLEGKISWTQDGPKITASILGELREGVSYSVRRRESGTPTSHTPELRKKTVKVISRSVFVSLVQEQFISLVSLKRWSQLIPCFSLFSGH